MADADRCVCCGDIIPEGRLICLMCERAIPTKTVTIIKAERRVRWWKRLRRKFLSFWRSLKSKV